MISNVRTLRLNADCDLPYYEVSATFDATLEESMPSDHVIYVPVAAISNRMEFYDLDTPEDAFKAILREHYVRLNGSEEPADRVVDLATGTARHKSWRDYSPAERGQKLGGLRSIPVELDDVPERIDEIRSSSERSESGVVPVSEDYSQLQ